MCAIIYSSLFTVQVAIIQKNKARKKENVLVFTVMFCEINDDNDDDLNNNNNKANK